MEGGRSGSKGVPPQERSLMLWENAARLYRLEAEPPETVH